MIDLSKYSELKHFATLRDTSIDKHDSSSVAYMTNSLMEVIDFDAVKDAYVKLLKLFEIPKSNDALFEDGKGNIVFVEFKNGYLNENKKFEVRKKIYDSTLIITDILSIRIRDMRQSFKYILVYNKKTNENNPDIINEKKTYVPPSTSYNDFAKTTAMLAQEEIVFFRIKMFENYCFKKVHTYNEEEFNNYLKSIGDSVT